MSETTAIDHTVLIEDLPQHLPRGIGVAPCSECGGEGSVPCHVCDEMGRTCCKNPCCNGSHRCDGCDGGTRLTCPACVGVPDNEVLRVQLADEATRLWRRDVGRGVVDGTRKQYVDMAAAAFALGDLTCSYCSRAGHVKGDESCPNYLSYLRDTRKKEAGR